MGADADAPKSRLQAADIKRQDKTHTGTHEARKNRKGERKQSRRPEEDTLCLMMWVDII